MNLYQSTIRNFCVISHIDHGKTTLTDRFLQATGTIAKKDFEERFLDSNPIEKERGITIKLAPVRMRYLLNANSYILNLIDTPGHVDFSYEVSRSLNACEGAILLVDATQGIQAQTMANANLAMASHLELIPVINKIDLANAEIDRVKQELQDSFGFKASEILLVSAKTGAGVPELLKAVIDRIPSPAVASAKEDSPLQALVFNSFYHPHHGVIACVRLVNGQITASTQLKFFSNATVFKTQEIGYFSPSLKPTQQLTCGEVGYLATGLKDISLCRVGDTIVESGSAVSALPGYQEPLPVVFMDFYPIDNQDFIKLKTSLEKFHLTDSSITYNPVNSAVLGSGFKIGFQGLLHAEIVQERLEREFDLNLITTSPSVEYQIELKKNHQLISILSPADFPDPSLINQTLEPYIDLSLFTPLTYLGGVMDLCREYRAELKSQEFFGSQVKLVYFMPLRELISGFFDRLKSVSSGFASLDWRFSRFVLSDIVKLEILLNRQLVEPLSVLTVRPAAVSLALKLAKKLKAAIPRQQFELPIQVVLGGKILARETIKAYRKDVTVKLHAADLSRKAKLLASQKRGKKRMKRVGKVNLSQEAFLAVVRR
ncbi:MAG: translation elongation factor 4 [Candidatus Beckwithbacteria bacterium]|nr:translation elongation factor 4 [Candidatus Beckwithbacteria bacterium]